MEVKRLKQYIIDNNLFTQVLEQLGCHGIKDKCSYIQCANPDGDNTSAITLYKDNLNVIDYTRDLSPINSSPDLFTLVQFFKQCNFFFAIKFVCECIGISYYYDFDKSLPKSLIITRLLTNSVNGDKPTEGKPLKRISENILNYYRPYVNDLFYNDSIPYEVQQEFEIGYDEQTNRITIPIRDEIGSLVGVKGRWFGNINENIEKYIYLEPCSKSQILYGLYKTYNSIKEQQLVYVVEAEKGVLQMFSYGITNVVATCGKQVSQSQIDKLSRLCVDICFLFDKDVSFNELKELSNKFVNKSKIMCAIDNDNILTEKESPTDNYKKLKHLLDNNIVVLKG